jgi:hypothetical protein
VAVEGPRSEVAPVVVAARQSRVTPGWEMAKEWASVAAKVCESVKVTPISVIRSRLTESAPRRQQPATAM